MTNSERIDAINAAYNYGVQYAATQAGLEIDLIALIKCRQAVSDLLDQDVCVNGIYTHRLFDLRVRAFALGWHKFEEAFNRKVELPHAFWSQHTFETIIYDLDHSKYDIEYD